MHLLISLQYQTRNKQNFFFFFFINSHFPRNKGNNLKSFLPPCNLEFVVFCHIADRQNLLYSFNVSIASLCMNKFVFRICNNDITEGYFKIHWSIDSIFSHTSHIYYDFMWLCGPYVKFAFLRHDLPVICASHHCNHNSMKLNMNIDYWMTSFSLKYR